MADQSFTLEAIKERVENIAKRAERESHIRIVGCATVMVDYQPSPLTTIRERKRMKLKLRTMK